MALNTHVSLLIVILVQFLCFGLFFQS